MIARVGALGAIALTLAGCGQKAEPKEAQRAAPLKLPTLEEMIVQNGRKEGKPQWDIDCDLAFVGNLDAAKRAREALLRLPYSQQSPRSQSCEGIVHTTIEKGGWK